MNEIIIRPALPGEASYVAYLQTTLYRDVYQFRGVFEHYILASMVQFLAEPAGSGLWVAHDESGIIGSIAIFRTDAHTAQLRWFLVSEKSQGKGVGRRLMSTAMDFCERQGYRHVFLWTISMLEAARHIYTDWGFRPTEEKPNTEWTGMPLTEERWDYHAQPLR